MTPEDLPLGEFPGTNTKPVINGIRSVPQDPNLFADQDEEAY